MQEKILEILKMNVVPSVRDAESMTMAMACARGALECRAEIDRIKVTVDLNTMKNAYGEDSTAAPGGGMVLAAVAGALRSRQDGEPVHLDSLTEQELAVARKFIAEDRVNMDVDGSRNELFIQAEVYAGDHKVLVRFEGSHNNITLVEVDGRPLARENDQLEANRFYSTKSFLEFLSYFSLAELTAVIDQIDLGKIAFLGQGVDMIERAAEAGLALRPGIGYGAALSDLISRQEISHNVLSYVRIKAGAAADARMGGVDLPIMASFGNGNYGIVIYSALSVVANKEKPSPERLIRAIAISHLLVGVTIFYTGLLTAHCGCTVAAGASATVGAVYLMGGSVQEMDNAFRLFISNLGGIICGGSNVYCAQKIGTAAVSVIENAYLAVRSKFIPKELGVVGRDYRETLENLKTLTQEGMNNINPVLVDLLARKNGSNGRACPAAAEAD